jgi:hypothetical protein
MINAENYHYLYRLAKRTVPFLHKKNRFDKVMDREKNGDANQLISDLIKSDKPFMAGRLGSVETRFFVNYKLKKNISSDISGIIKTLNGNINIFWKNNPILLNELCMNAGFFPKNPALGNNFIKIYDEAIENLDVLGVWNEMEYQITNIPEETKLCKIRELEPWFFENPWSSELKYKKVLVIHPFEDSIKNQFLQKDKLYKNSKILPDFELKTIKAVQTIAGQKSSFENWFDALDSMKEKIIQTDFDIAIIGCGAYGFPLASFIKDFGKQAIHLGGVTQLLFGIKGKRWEGWKHYTELRKDKGENWIFTQNIPKNFEKIEDGCYW